MKRKSAKRVMCLILAAVILLAAGCGNPSEKGQESIKETGASPDDGMGRYLEEETDLSEELQAVCEMKKFHNGELVITDRLAGIRTSRDGGTTWESEERQWLSQRQNTSYIMDMGIRADGALGIIYDEYEAMGEDGFILTPEYLLLKEDGTEIPFTLPLTEEEMYAKKIWMSDQGRVFVTAFGDNIYEIKEDGSSQLFLTMEGRPMLLRFWENLMLIDGYDFKEPLLYDLEKGEYVEDEALGAFVNEAYGDRQFNGGSWYDLYFFFGEDGTLYMAGKEGLHRHVIGEDGVEQLIDGSLSRLGSPQYGIKGMELLENGEFLAVFNSGKLVRFTFDPDTPAVPDKKLTVYSLRESYSIRVAITAYQVTHPDVFVEYETGMGEGDALTREDALKKLNTRIMTGEGPDLLVLDEMPMDAYMEKGLLLDLGSFMEELSKEEELFENLFQAFEREGSIYAVPGEVTFPVMLGREKYVSKMKDLASVAGEIEQIREDNPGKDILGICSAEGMMKIFAAACAPAWKQENGEIDREAVGDFLTQMKRIYDAQMDGISEKSVSRYESDSSWTSREFGEDWVYDLSFYGVNTLDYVGGYTQFMVGMNTYPWGYYDLTSAARVNGFGDTLLEPLAGQSSRVFVPQTILGINAASAQTELAEDFLKAFLGKEIQCTLGGFGVNRSALDKSFTVDERELGEEGVYGMMGMIDEDGVEVFMDVYYPSEDKIKIFMGWMESADTPYIADTVLERNVFGEGAKYIQGDQSLQEALDAIWQQLAIYMSE